MNPLLGLKQRGQYVWLDHISRSLIRGGGLQRLIDADGLGGVTSNPTIFEKAIAGGTDYDAGLHRAIDADRDISNRALAEHLVVEDIQMAADVLRPVYRRFRELFDGEPFAALKRRGARVQRPLWASTGTKNASYSDVLYIEALIGPDTITTVPPATLDAFRDHGRVRVTLGTEEQDTDAVLSTAAALGVDVHGITELLQADGIKAFASSFDQLVAAVAEKRRQIFTTAS
jgi:transaldolase